MNRLNSNEAIVILRSYFRSSMADWFAVVPLRINGEKGIKHWGAKFAVGRHCGVISL